MSSDLTPRRALTVFGVLGLSGMIGCARSRGGASADGEPGDFDFTGSAPPGPVIPVAARRSASGSSGEPLDESAFDSASMVTVSEDDLYDALDHLLAEGTPQ